MLTDVRLLGGRDSICLNNNNSSSSNSSTDHPWSSSYNKVQGFFRWEMGLANSKHKMTCDRNRGLGFVAKEHIVKSQEGTGGGSSNNLSKNRARRQTKPPLAPGEGHTRPDVARNSCAPKAPPSPARWNRSVGRQQKKKHCLFVKGRLGECRFVENCHGQTPDTHPSLRKCSPAPATTRFKGQANCGSPVNGQGQERDCVREPFQEEPYGADMPDTGKQDLAAHHYLKATLNSDADCEADKSWRDRVTPKVTKLESPNQSNNSSDSLILPEVPGGEPNSAKQQQQQRQQHQQNCSQMGESTTNSERLPSSAAQGPKLESESVPEPEPRLLWTNRKRRAVRDQIRRVVAELEGILHGLKEVHLEMKEVVQQIELLTSAIDPTEDRPHTGLHSDTLGSSSSSGVMVGGMKERGEDGGDTDLGRAESAPSPQRSDPSETSSPVLSNNVANDEAQQTENSTKDRIDTLPTNTPDSDSPPANQSSDPTEAESRKEGVKQATLKASILGSRAKKPPPYPHHTPKTAKTDKGRDCPKAPPYPVKRRLLSTTV